jgi:hypothetical protein
MVKGNELFSELIGRVYEAAATRPCGHHSLKGLLGTPNRIPRY